MEGAVAPARANQVGAKSVFWINSWQLAPAEIPAGHLMMEEGWFQRTIVKIIIMDLFLVLFG